MKTTLKKVIAGLAISAALVGCDKDDNDNNNNKPDWGPTISDDMLAIIKKQDSLGAQPIQSLTPMQARMQPTIADAVKALAMQRGVMMQATMVDTTGQDIPVTGGSIHVRIYKPRTGTNLPVVVYYHGGGWVIADINTYDASAKAIAEKANTIVVSVNYRQGPEYKFPTAHNDSYAAYAWAVRNASVLGGDSTRMGVAGESAGGNLACNVSMMTRITGIRKPKYQVLVYPVASNNMYTDSYNKYANAKPLNKPSINWFLSFYLSTITEAADPRMNLIAANLSNLPPTLIINAEIDPLRDDGAALETALRNAGVTVNRRLYDGVTHEFFGTSLLIPQALDAQNQAANALKSSL